MKTCSEHAAASGEPQSSYLSGSGRFGCCGPAGRTAPDRSGFVRFSQDLANASVLRAPCATVLMRRQNPEHLNADPDCVLSHEADLQTRENSRGLGSARGFHHPCLRETEREAPVAGNPRIRVLSTLSWSAGPPARNPARLHPLKDKPGRSPGRAITVQVAKATPTLNPGSLCSNRDSSCSDHSTRPCRLEPQPTRPGPTCFRLAVVTFCWAPDGRPQVCWPSAAPRRPGRRTRLGAAQPANVHGETKPFGSPRRGRSVSGPGKVRCRPAHAPIPT